MSKLRDTIEEIRKNLPENFSLELNNNPGLYYEDEKNGLQRICNPIAVTAIKRKADGTAYGKEITFWSVDKKEHTCYILQKTLLDANATRIYMIKKIGISAGNTERTGFHAGNVRFTIPQI